MYRDVNTLFGDVVKVGVKERGGSERGREEGRAGKGLQRGFIGTGCVTCRSIFSPSLPPSLPPSLGNAFLQVRR